jgi:hypothetical protein
MSIDRHRQHHYSNIKGFDWFANGGQPGGGTASAVVRKHPLARLADRSSVRSSQPRRASQSLPVHRTDPPVTAIT